MKDTKTWLGAVCSLPTRFSPRTSGYSHPPFPITPIQGVPTDTVDPCSTLPWGRSQLLKNDPAPLTQILYSNCIMCGSRGRMGMSRGFYAPLPGKSQPRKSYLCLCLSILVFPVTSHSIRLSPVALVFPQALDRTWQQVPLTLLTPTASQTSIPPTFRKIAKPSWRQLTASYNLPQHLTLCMMRL